MAFSRGPVLVRDGLVLYYDAANIKSFRGEPTTNVLTGVSYIYGTVNDTYFKTNYGTETVYIPALGTKTANYCNILNDFNGGSGNCCPAPFFFGDFTVSPSTTYTYQIIFRTSTGYNHPNYMYHYQYNGGTYVTEFGLFSTSRVEELGDGWKHGWGTFTTNASTNRLLTYLFHYEYGVWNKIQVAGIMLSQRSTPLDPKFIIPPTASRGTTVASGGGVIDISNNGSGAEIVGPVYNSSNKGSLFFDGSDDFLSISTINMGNGDLSWTINVWTKTTTAASSLGQGSIISNSSGGPVYSMLGVNSGKIVYWTYQNNAWSQKLGNMTINDGNWHMLTWVNYSNNTMDMYVDGVLDVSVANSTSGNNNPLDIIGGSWAGRYFGFISNIYIYKNKQLSSVEILQNYNATKGRFI
jgi:hypothetical protein